MAREFFHAYHSYLESMQRLSMEERGRLFTALLAHSAEKELPELGTADGILYDTFVQTIDREKAAYDAKCKKNRENGRKGGIAKGERYAEIANAPQEEDEEKYEEEKEYEDKEEDKYEDKDEDKEKEEGKGEEITPLYSPLGKHTQGEGPADSFDEPLRSAVIQWLEYKREKRQSYKPQGLSVLIDKIHKAAGKHGDRAVADIICESMACNYQGIMWDRIGRRQQQTGNPFLEMLREEEGYGQI